MSNSQQTPVEKKYYRAKEIALMGNFGRTCLYRFIEKGYLPQPLKLGFISLWRKEDVDTFFEKLEKGDFKE